MKIIKPIFQIIIVLTLIPTLFSSILFMEDRINEVPKFFIENVTVSCHRHIIHSSKGNVTDEHLFQCNNSIYGSTLWLNGNYTRGINLVYVWKISNNNFTLINFY